MEITRLNAALKQEQTKHQKESEEDGSDKKKLLQVRQENQRLHLAHDKCLRDKNQAERDLDSAIQALHQLKHNEKEQMSLAVRTERLALNETKATIDGMMQKQNDLRTRCSDLEDELEEVQKQLERSNERNSWYEKNHGLTDAVRYQRKLEADIRRRDYDLKQLNHKLGIETDRRMILLKACDWLKEKAGLEQNFVVNEDEIKIALECEENQLRTENLELSRQVDALEGSFFFLKYLDWCQFHFSHLTV